MRDAIFEPAKTLCQNPVATHLFGRAVEAHGHETPETIDSGPSTRTSLSPRTRVHGVGEATP